MIANSDIWLVYCPTDNMLADTLLKALLSAKGKHFDQSLGLVPAWGGVLNNKPDFLLFLTWWTRCFTYQTAPVSTDPLLFPPTPLTASFVCTIVLIIPKFPFRYMYYLWYIYYVLLVYTLCAVSPPCCLTFLSFNIMSNSVRKIACFEGAIAL